MWVDQEDMRDFQHSEENGGREREIAYTPNYSNPEAPDYVSPEDRDPEIEEMVHAIYARDNAGRRERNHRAEMSALESHNEELRGLLKEAGITPPPMPEG